MVTLTIANFVSWFDSNGPCSSSETTVVATFLVCILYPLYSACIIHSTINNMPASASPKKVVLCVDDDEAGLRVRKMLLEAYGYEVLCSTDGPDGLRKLIENKIDAVILDYFMPEMDG